MFNNSIDPKWDSDPVRDVREEREHGERLASTRRLLHGFAAAVTVMALTLGALVWYAYPVLQRQDTSLARLPQMEKTVGEVRQGLEGTASRLQNWSTQQEALRQRVDNFTQETRERLESASKQASEAAGVMARQIHAEIDGRLAGVRTDVDNLKTAQQRDQNRIAGLQQELTEVRAEATRQSNELAASRQQLNADVVAATRQIGAVRDDQQRDRRDVDTMAANLAVERVDFEVSKGRSRELAPGISIGVTGTNVTYRRVNGWMWVMPDRRTIWLRDQNALQPIVFYGLTDGKKRELVVTQVAQNSIVGYLILPKSGDTGKVTTAGMTDRTDSVGAR